MTEPTTESADQEPEEAPAGPPDVLRDEHGMPFGPNGERIWMD